MPYSYFRGYRGPLFDTAATSLGELPLETPRAIVTMTGTGTLIANPANVQYASATLTGTGTMSTKAKLRAKATITGTGSLSAKAILLAKASLLSTGALSGTAHATAPPIVPGVPVDISEMELVLYPKDNLSSPIRLLSLTKEREFEEQVSESGAGKFKQALDGSAPTLGQLVGVNVKGVRAWTMWLEEFERTALTEGGKGATLNQWSGRGHAAMLERGLILPTNGLNHWPKQADLFLDYRHTGYNKAGWTTPREVTSVETAKIDWPIIPWPYGMPANELAQLGSKTMVMWSSDGSLTGHWTGTPATSHKINYFIQDFSTPWEGTYAFFFSTLNQGSAYIDDVPIANAGEGLSGVSESSGLFSGPVRLSAGNHRLALWIHVWPAFPGILNLAGYASALYIPGYPPTLICQSAGNQGIVMKEWPSEPPGMTPGNAVRLVAESIQARGALPWLQIYSFSDTHDSAGQPWGTPMPTISTKIQTDFYTFLREASATYFDFRVNPLNFSLELYKFGTMNNIVSGLTFSQTTNLTGLSQHGKWRISNVLYGDFQDQYYEAVDSISVAANGRHEAQYAIGSVDSPYEAQRVLDKALFEFANQREEITASVDGPVGYVDYKLGQRANVPDSTGSLVQRRITAITVSDDPQTGRTITTPHLGNTIV